MTYNSKDINEIKLYDLIYYQNNKWMINRATPTYQ